jgi:hypothetical protein
VSKSVEEEGISERAERHNNWAARFGAEFGDSMVARKKQEGDKRGSKGKKGRILVHLAECESRGV